MQSEFRPQTAVQREFVSVRSRGKQQVCFWELFKMKNKLFAAALAAATLDRRGNARGGARFPRHRYDQDFRGDGRGDPSQDFRGDHGDWRMRNQITVRQDGRQFSFDRSDRAFYRLTDRPFGFRAGPDVRLHRSLQARTMPGAGVLATLARADRPHLGARLDRGFFFANGDRRRRDGDRPVEQSWRRWPRQRWRPLSRR